MTEPKKRNRLINVCTNCYRKKIKCDKQNPCTNCIKSNLICEYSKKIITKKTQKVKQKELIITPSNSNRYKKLDILAKAMIYTKPSRIFLRSSMMNSFAMENSLATKCILELRLTFQKERELWKKKYMPYQPMMSSEDLISDSDIALTIENKIKPNYHAMIERLNYFKVHLNKLLFNNAIPADLLIDIFNHYFTRTDDNKIIFSKPKKSFEYQPLSLVFLIVDLVELFTRSESSLIFNFNLLMHGKHFTEIAIRMLNHSKFTKKQSIFTIFCLICIIFTLMIYGDIRSLGFDYSNINPLFQTCYNVAISIGLHLDLDKIEPFFFKKKRHSSNEKSPPFFLEEIPKKCSKRLWNLIVILDTEFCLSDSQPLINFKYCHGFYENELDGIEFIVEGSKIIREIPKITYALNGASLNDLIELEANIFNLTKDLVSFSDVKMIEVTPSVWLRVRIKLKLLAFHSALACFILQVLDSELLGDDDNEESIQLNDVKLEMNTKIKLNFLYLIKFRQDISSDIKSLKFIIFFRQELWHCVGIATIDYVQSLFNFLIKTKSRLNLHSMGRTDFNVSTNDVEYALYNFTDMTDIGELIKPSYILNQLEIVLQSSFNSASQNLSLNYNCFIMAKLCSVFVILLKVCDGLNTNHNFFTRDLEGGVQKIVAMTKKKLSNELNLNSTTGLDTPVSGIDPNVVGDWGDEIGIFPTSQESNESTNSKLDFEMEEVLNSVLEDSNMNKIWNDLNGLMNDPTNCFDYSLSGLT